MGLQHHHHELTLGLSFLLGAAHALEPGHGKTALFVHMASGPRGFWHPVVMGISTAVSHSVSLFAIAFMVHAAHHLTAGDHHHEEVVSSALQWVSAAIVIGVGLWLLRQALTGTQSTCCGQHHHGKDIDHARHERDQFACCGHGHSGQPTDSSPDVVDRKSSATMPERAALEPHSRLRVYSTTALLGIAVGLLPCPSALAAFFAGLSTGTPSQAYAIIGLFAAGIAASLSITGYVIRLVGSRWSARSAAASSSSLWPLLRALVILGVGLAHLIRLDA